MKEEFKQYGVYGIIINDDKIVLIKKHGGPYDGKLDLPGGGIKFHERPEDTLKRELKEEVGIEVQKYELIDTDSVTFEWPYKDKILDGHHVGIFYKVLEYTGEIQENVKIDDDNNDSLGAKFYDIKTLRKEDLSLIGLLELEKMGLI